MDIAALVNPVSEAPPRRSLSGSHHTAAPSPATSSAKLPTPPLSHKPMARKRKRHDPKPIWAVREDELFDGRTLHQQDQRQNPRPTPAPPTPRPQPHAQPPPDAMRMSNGPPTNSMHAPNQPLATLELVGYERPISDDPHVYDDISRKVCDFIWNAVVKNDIIRKAIEESPLTQVEIEARWGQIKDRATGQRMYGMHDSECVVRRDYADQTMFESTMTMDQHKRMNMYLNSQVQQSKLPGAMREVVEYQHTREIDQFFELNQEGFQHLPPRTQHIIKHSTTRPRIRVTYDAKNNNAVVRKLIKHRIGNLEISSPGTEWDYRIGVNLEINYPGPVEGLTPVVEPNKSVEDMKRSKDRVSYSWTDAFQIDLTQVSQGRGKNHELELELNSDVLLEHADNVDKKLANSFEALINGMMNNLRVLSREITPAG